MNKELTWDDVAARLTRASRHFLDKDSYLLLVDANERSMTHKYAMYLEPEFPDYDVDCEYNRKGSLPKKLHVEGADPTKLDDEDATTVFPDIIVHHRGEPLNLVVIEAKKRAGNNRRDRDKLRAFLKEGDYGYEFGVLLRFVTGSNPDIALERYE